MRCRWHCEAADCHTMPSVMTDSILARHGRPPGIQIDPLAVASRTRPRQRWPLRTDDRESPPQVGVWLPCWATAHVLTSPWPLGRVLGPYGHRDPCCGRLAGSDMEEVLYDSGRGVCAPVRQGGWTRRGPRGGGDPSKTALASMCCAGGGHTRRGAPAEQQVGSQVGRHSGARASGRPVRSRGR